MEFTLRCLVQCGDVLGFRDVVARPSFSMECGDGTVSVLDPIDDLVYLHGAKFVGKFAVKAVDGDPSWYRLAWCARRPPPCPPPAPPHPDGSPTSRRLPHVRTAATRRCMRWTQVELDFYADTGSVRLDANKARSMEGKARWEKVWGREEVEQFACP